MSEANSSNLESLLDEFESAVYHRGDTHRQELARKAIVDFVAGVAHETAAPQSKFDLAFEIMRQLETERMDTMQSCHFGYVLRVERETKAPLVRGHLEGCTCSLCKRIPLFREHPDAL